MIQVSFEMSIFYTGSLIRGTFVRLSFEVTQKSKACGGLKKNEAMFSLFGAFLFFSN